MGRTSGLLAFAVLAAACRVSPPLAAGTPTPQGGVPELEQTAEAPVREADRVLDQGFVLRPHTADEFGLSLRVPVHLAWTQFDLIEGISLDNLATVATVPTFELVLPVGERWTLVPFAGLGGAYQNGDTDLIGGQSVIGLATGGVRATRWQSFSERYWFGLMGEFLYAAALTRRDGVLGDWGTLDSALELRRDFGAPGSGARFQGGLYLQSFYFWDALELDVNGIDPATLQSNAEVGISLGTTSPVKVWGFTLPRVFVGAILGDLLSGVRIRFGRL